MTSTSLFPQIWCEPVKVTLAFCIVGGGIHHHHHHHHHDDHLDCSRHPHHDDHDVMALMFTSTLLMILSDKDGPSVELCILKLTDGMCGLVDVFGE